MVLEYQLLLAEIRKELESQLDGLRQSFTEPVSIAITTMPSPATVQLPTPYHDDSIATNKIRIENGFTSPDPDEPRDADAEARKKISAKPEISLFSVRPDQVRSECHISIHVGRLERVAQIAFPMPMS
jgi:hypothetical protein